MAQPERVFPLDHPLAGCEAKLARAHQNFELLDEELRRYLQGHGDAISHVGQLDPETQRHIRSRVGPVVEPDLILAALIGDFIHDLRSLLDHLAFELSFCDSGGVIPSRKIAFPCCRKRAEWGRPRVQVDKLGGINKTHRAMIYRRQPCYRRKDAPTNARTIARRARRPLADLQDFWDHDKHRTLQPVASAPFHIHGDNPIPHDCIPTGELRMEPSILGRPLKEGTESYWMPVEPFGPDPYVEMNLTVGVLIAFRNGLPAQETLGQLGNWVKSVIDWFAPEFETRKARRLWGLPRGGWIEGDPIRMKTTLYTTQRGS